MSVFPLWNPVFGPLIARAAAHGNFAAFAAALLGKADGIAYVWSVPGKGGNDNCAINLPDWRL